MDKGAAKKGQAGKMGRVKLDPGALDNDGRTETMYDFPEWCRGRGYDFLAH